MRENDDGNRVYLDGGVGQDPYHPRPKGEEPQRMEETPFCLGIVGNFSGRRIRQETGGPSDRARPSIRRVTPENVLDLAGLSPEIVVAGLPEGSPDLSITFHAMVDFHPDRLYDRLEIFRPHREAMDRIKTGGGKKGPSASTSDPASGLLEAVLGETELETPKTGSEIDGDLDAFIRRVVKPHVVEAAPDHSGQIEDLDRQASGLMSSLLNAPGFQELEALWRSVVFLLSRIEVSTSLRVYLIDVSEEDLVADLLSTDEPTEWGFAHTLLDPVSEKGEELRWAALLGTLQIGHAPHHVPLLQRIGLLAESGQIPWFSGADPSLLGSTSLQDQPDPKDWTEPLDPLWEDLRGNPEAEWISLALPGFLLRPPYGPDGGKVKRFDYLEQAPDTQDLLWGNPSILWGVVMGQEFAHSGWGMGMSGRQTVSEIPLHPTPDGWATCVRTPLSVTAASRVREMGLSPVVASRNEPAVQLHGPASISTSEKSLGAWWRNPI